MDIKMSFKKGLAAFKKGVTAFKKHVKGYFSSTCRWTVIPVIDFTYEYFPKGMFTSMGRLEKHLVGLEVRWLKWWTAIEVRL